LTIDCVSGRGLVRVHKSTHPIFNSEDVVVHTVNVNIVVRRVTDKTSRVDAAEVQGTRGLEFARVEAEGVQEQLLVVTIRHDVGGVRLCVKV